MIIAFLGKGGSGKSTMATALVRALLERAVHVLAVDADHNMDLSYNLGALPTVFLGSDPYAIKRHIGVTETTSFLETRRVAEEKNITFSLSPADEFTRTVATELSPTLSLITAGPHTDIVRSGEHCSHSLAAPLKVYLPLLKLKKNQVVVIDERAGTDPVATGILQGVDLAVIVREQTVNSRRVAEQIQKELTLAQVPHIVVENKIHGIEADARLVEQAVLEHM